MVTRVLGDHEPKLDHAAIGMVRSSWWQEIPRCWPSEPRGWAFQFLTVNGKISGRSFHFANEVTGEIPWR